MRNVAVVLALTLALLPLVGCESSSSPAPADASSSIISTEDGATCGCATPDCLPNCSDLPTCKLACATGMSGAVLDWVDPCGTVQYTQACPTGCTDAASAVCQ